MIDAKNKVNFALLTYQLSNSKDINAGYNILRYAKMGYIKINADATDEFMSWYPSDPSYVILRLVKQGKAAYQPTVAEQLKELNYEI